LIKKNYSTLPLPDVANITANNPSINVKYYPLINKPKIIENIKELIKLTELLHKYVSDFEKENAMFGFLIAFAGNVFEIGSDMSISQNIDGLYAIGSGSDYALGALSGQVPNLSKPDWAAEQILEALAISAKYDINTSAPFQVEVQKV
jgi:ATP-dependent protease HslVU (ClpYQ) peptidase subunit